MVEHCVNHDLRSQACLGFVWVCVCRRFRDSSKSMCVFTLCAKLSRPIQVSKSIQLTVTVDGTTGLAVAEDRVAMLCVTCKVEALFIIPALKCAC